MSVDTKNIRNVVLLGHSGCGKTTLAETMLFEGHEIHRRGTVQDHNTTSDYSDIEHHRENSLYSTLMHLNWKDSKINIIDTPGLDDFCGEVISSLKVASTGVMVLNGAHGVEVGTEIIWEYIEKFQTPTIFVINQMDHEKCDYDNTLEQAQNRFGSKVFPIQYPLNQGKDFNAIVDILRMTVYEFPPEGGKPEKVDIPADEMARAQELHNQLVEIAAENDEGLMEIFFDKGSLTEEELTKGLKIAIAAGDFCPAFVASAQKDMGSGRILGFINDICPNPAERPPVALSDGTTLACDSSKPTTLFIYKTVHEPRIGMVSYFKVYSGELKSSDELINAQTGAHERFSQILVANGKNRSQVDGLKAGDLGAAVKLKDSHTNQTLNTKGTDLVIAPIDFPTSRIRTAITTQNKTDLEKMVKALHMIEEEDPTLHSENSVELKQLILYGQGQLHFDVVKSRIQEEFGVTMEFEKPRIPYRETITRASNDSYRHKKQSGGAGQFAEVHMRIEPYFEGMPDPSGLSVRNTDLTDLPWGGKLAFLWCIVGGSIDAKFASAIKKGVMQKMEEGPLTGSYCRDIRVSIFDGKMHPVDSNDMAFQIAGSMVFRNAFKQAGAQILEPIYNVEILCPEESMGDIMGDLQTRRAMIMGMDSDGHYQKIIAKVPEAEMYMYSSTLRSLSQGRAKFTREFAEYNAVTPDIQQHLIDAYQAEEVEG
ncbi:MAG TPA: elongation factor G [Saprospiraceae bacterium]|nr:elongation factor G [Saprospiraceae bacterium]MCB9270918.1 elongation factor G [Lewinellaceae bacterium]HPG08199.1 elongation factor G [Saprospiraceae bacterium]HPQ98181.1 elongation factor G [Saprospiraceae bacterium]HQU52325.1 elongation factor G [Saprospiraceae bacterium]